MFFARYKSKVSMMGVGSFMLNCFFICGIICMVYLLGLVFFLI